MNTNHVKYYQVCCVWRISCVKTLKKRLRTRRVLGQNPKKRSQNLKKTFAKPQKNVRKTFAERYNCLVECRRHAAWFSSISHDVCPWALQNPKKTFAKRWQNVCKTLKKRLSLCGICPPPPEKTNETKVDWAKPSSATVPGYEGKLMNCSNTKSLLIEGARHRARQKRTLKTIGRRMMIRSRVQSPMWRMLEVTTKPGNAASKSDELRF